MIGSKQMKRADRCCSNANLILKAFFNGKNLQAPTEVPSRLTEEHAYSITMKNNNEKN
jgi:hypothetical protein